MHNRVKMLMVAILILTLKMVASQVIVDNSLGEGESTAIDFSGGVVDESGAVCVLREEQKEKVEQREETQCTQQNVTQCYNTYITQYKDVIKEKCEEVFIKTCRIVMRERAYNHTSKTCKRAIVKQCNNYNSIPGYDDYDELVPRTVCQTIYETECNTTQAGTDLPTTRCGQVHRQICAQESCSFVEGELECREATIENTIEVPEETCTMDPQVECKNVTASVPQLIPEEICRSVPKEVCQAVFLEPKTLKSTVMVKYCMNQDNGLPEREEGREDPRAQKLRQPKSVFREDRTQDIPVKFLSNRERLLNGIS